MSRTNRPGSRSLIVVLALVAVLGSVAIAYRLNRDASPAPSAPVAAIASTAPPALPAASLIARATTQPAAVLAAPAAFVQPPAPPTTRPMPDIAVSLPAESLLADSRAKMQAGQWLAARDQLNHALQSGPLPGTLGADAKALLTTVSQTTVFSRQTFTGDAYSSTYVVQPGDSLSHIASAYDMTWDLLGQINATDPKHLRAGATIKVIQGPFFALVTKSRFAMDIYLGGLPGERSSMFVAEYPVGLGRDDSTPTGTWIVEPQKKLRHPTYYSPRGEGIIAADDPRNPLGGYWIGLTGTEGQAIGKLSYGVHGTTEPSSIGHQSSLGCIRMNAPDIALVFNLMVEGKSLVRVQD